MTENQFTSIDTEYELVRFTGRPLGDEHIKSVFLAESPPFALSADGTERRPISAELAELIRVRRHERLDDDQFDKDVKRERLYRRVVRHVNAEEFAEAIGERPKRTIDEIIQLPAPEPVMEKVLGKDANLLGGDSGMGKSLLARDWALSVATGMPWMGHRVPEPRSVLFVISEGSHDLADRWMASPLWGEAREPICILDAAVNLCNADDVDWLLKEYEAERPGLVVFDVVYGMGMADDTGSRDVGPVFASMKRISREWDAATLAIGHPKHHRKDVPAERRFRGSSMWRQLAVADWFIGDGRLTCEKSKLANHTDPDLNLAYEPAYPHLRYLDSSEVVVRTAQSEGQRRYLAIQADFDAMPRDTDRARERRIAPWFAQTSQSTLLRAIRKERMRREAEDAK